MKVYNKLVRDKIPQICKDNGAIPVVRVLSDNQEYLCALLDKLIEEAQEVKQTPVIEELADVAEVLKSIGDALGYTRQQVEAERQMKAEKRGGFNDRIFLISTEE